MSAISWVCFTSPPFSLSPPPPLSLPFSHVIIYSLPFLLAPLLSSHVGIQPFTMSPALPACP